MGILMIRCPKTGLTMSTGWQVEAAVFASKPGILQSDILLALPHRARMVRQRRVGLRRRRRRMRTGVPVAGRLRLRAMLRGSSVMALRMRR